MSRVLVIGCGELTSVAIQMLSGADEVFTRTVFYKQDKRKM